VRRALELRDVPDVAVVQRDVEVAHDDERLRRVEAVEPLAQRAEPRQLVVVVRVAERPAVRHVRRRDVQRTALRRRQARLGVAVEHERHVDRPTRDSTATPFQRPSPACAAS
jgi:hypothetical protein